MPNNYLLHCSFLGAKLPFTLHTMGSLAFFLVSKSNSSFLLFFPSFFCVLFVYNIISFCFYFSFFGDIGALRSIVNFKDLQFSPCPVMALAILLLIPVSMCVAVFIFICVCVYVCGCVFSCMCLCLCVCMCAG